LSTGDGNGNGNDWKGYKFNDFSEFAGIPNFVQLPKQDQDQDHPQLQTQPQSPSSVGTQPKVTTFNVFNLIFENTVRTSTRGPLQDLGVLKLKTSDMVTLLDCNKMYNKLEEFIKTLNSLESKGFINNDRIQDIPLIAPFLLPLTLPSKDENKDKDKDKTTVKDPLLYLRGDQGIDSYKWIYNLIMLNLYYVTLKAIQLIILLEGDTTESDFLSDFKSLSKLFYNKIDPSIRKSLQKRGISIIQNIYTGFDTEYKNVNAKTNHLLSVQLAVTTHTFIKIPKYKAYTLSTIDTLKNKDYKIKISKNSKFDYVKIENSLNDLIDSIRLLKFSDHDNSIYTLITGLMDKSYKYIEKEDFYIFSMPLTSMDRYIYYNKKGQGYSFKEIVIQSNLMGEPQLNKSYNSLIADLIDISKTRSQTLFIDKASSNINDKKDLDNYELLNESDFMINLENKFDVSALINNITKPSQESSDSLIDNNGDSINPNPNIKKLSRQYMSSFSSDKISVTKLKTNYYICHLTNADLSIMTDFELIRDELDIVNKSFINKGKPFVYQDTNIQIRDTMLLAPTGSKSLEAIGRLYGPDFYKKSLSKTELSDMSILLKTNKPKFQDYAIRDAEITLVHALWMEFFNFQINEVGIPITLSSLGSKYVKHAWQQLNYEGYQIHPNYLLGSASVTQTPQGLSHTKQIGLKLSYYIANYKGGRNESFMYGVDKNTYWIDYDLISAYTTALSLAGHPDYSKGRVLSLQEFNDLSFIDLLYSYVIIRCNFVFPSTVKYPSIPCFIDETTTVYPLTGSAILTGSEYILAIKQGASINIDECFYIPFSTKKKPFGRIIKDLQSLRKQYAKGTISNLIYKEMGNSIYGSVVKGMSDKRRFDIKTGKTLRMEGSDLSNPLIASWTTGFIRSVIGECLHVIQNLGGKIVSVTTDGFITDINDLENKIINFFDLNKDKVQIQVKDKVKDREKDEDNVKVKDKGDISLLKEYQRTRFEMFKDKTALEIKSQGSGIISWTTRGQLGLESQIKATTGFQNKNFTKNELWGLFLEKMQNSEKYLEFIQTSLRSAKDIYKEGGHVTMTYKDQIFRIHFDNRRRIVVPLELEDNFDWSNILLDSLPLTDVTEGRTLRFISKLHKVNVYNKYSTGTSLNTYKNYSDLAVRNFIKFYFFNPSALSLNGKEFENYNAIIKFVNEFDPKFRISKNSLSNLKNRNLIYKPVPRTKDTEDFVNYIKTKLPYFNESSFFQ
jgi:hypothetical protein